MSLTFSCKDTDVEDPNTGGTEGKPDQNEGKEEEVSVYQRDDDDDKSFSLLRFYPVVCTLDFGFWRQVNAVKLVKWRLETPIVPITGALVPLQAAAAAAPMSTGALSSSFPPPDRRSDAGSLGWRLHLEKDAFYTDSLLPSSSASHDFLKAQPLHAHPPFSASFRVQAPDESKSLSATVGPTPSSPPSLTQSFPVKGIFFNANSADDFRKLPRQQFIHQITSPIVRLLVDTLSLLSAIPLASATATDEQSLGLNSCLWSSNQRLSIPIHPPSRVSQSQDHQSSQVHQLSQDCQSSQVHQSSQFRPPSPLFQCLSPSNCLLSHLTSFLIFAFADLKSHLYYYNVALPVFRPTRDISGRVLLSSSDGDPPFALSRSHMALIGELLLGWTATDRVSGFSGVCALIRYKQGTNVFPSRDDSPSSGRSIISDWLEPLFSDPQAVRLDDGTGAIVSIWSLLIQFHRHKDAVYLSKSKFLLDTVTTEAVICVVDAVRSSDSETFGWPLRSILFALGFLGLAGRRLKLLAFKDGATGVQHFRASSTTKGESTITHPHDLSTAPHSTTPSSPARSTTTHSVGVIVDMPPSESFVLDPKDYDSGDASPASLSECTSPGRLKEDSLQQRALIAPGWLRHSKEDSQLLLPSSSTTQRHHASSVTFLVDLRRHMDPVVSQADAVHLNIRLIQWRILPSLDTLILQSLKFLLLGVGTLGCNILRALIAWGATQFTLVDSGRVALSSPVRQSLFLHQDATWNNGRGRLKVIAAKKRLLEIRPDLSINAIHLDIPMPGHPRYLLSTFSNSHVPRSSSSSASCQMEARQHLSDLPTSTAELPVVSSPSCSASWQSDSCLSCSFSPSLPTSSSQQQQKFSPNNLSSLARTVDLLEQLIDAHDVVLLLTDSRESRWLPSVLASTSVFRSHHSAASNSPSSASSDEIRRSASNGSPPQVRLQPERPYIPSHEYSTHAQSHPCRHHDHRPPSSLDPAMVVPCLRESSIAVDATSLSRPSSEFVDAYMRNELEAWDRLFASPPIFKFPLCLTVALGFDTFVVMRHGHRLVSHAQQQPHRDPETASPVKSVKEYQPAQQQIAGQPEQQQQLAGQQPPPQPPPLQQHIAKLLSCYFCNDLSAPADSLARRPLDQQCTVTRPGISLLAASVATELIAALSQHPEAPDASHNAFDYGPSDDKHSCLGATPHCVRGTLGDFRIVCTETEAFEHCISCSLPIAHKVCSLDKVQFIADAISRSEMLEEVSGLAAMKACRREDEIFTIEDELDD